MAFKEKEKPAKVFCLFHQKVDCLCIKPVTDNKNLIYRLESQIRLNNILKDYGTDEEVKKNQRQQTIDFQNRLDNPL
jgi:hypothetical protein